MSGVLTTQSTTECGHSGTVGTVGAAHFTVNGKGVLTTTGVASQSVTGCQIVPSTNPNGTPKDVACLTVTAVDKTEATRLTVGGVAVLIDPLGGATSGLKDSLPTKDLTASVVQTRLTAV